MAHRNQITDDPTLKALVDAAIEIAALCGTAKEVDSDRVAVIVDKLVAMLTRLIR